MASPAVPLTTSEALSGAFGVISILCWTVIYIPQLSTNYRNKSANGVSLKFLYLWLFGNACSFVGGVWAGVLPTILANALYNCLAEIVMITQCLYYRTPRATHQEQQQPDNEKEAQDPTDIALEEANNERQPLLPREQPTRQSVHKTSAWIKNTAAIIAVITTGSAIWALLYTTGLWQPTAVPIVKATTPTPIHTTNPLAQMLGYTSAFIFLMARIPQISKNHQHKSCEGLSVLFFMFSVLGNVTYSLNILLHSTEAHYLMKNLPWLIGSLGTIGEDLVIFGQFYVYGSSTKGGDGDEQEQLAV